MHIRSAVSIQILLPNAVHSKGWKPSNLSDSSERNRWKLRLHSINAMQPQRTGDQSKSQYMTRVEHKNHTSLSRFHWPNECHNQLQTVFQLVRMCSLKTGTKCTTNLTRSSWYSLWAVNETFRPPGSLRTKKHSEPVLFFVWTCRVQTFQQKLVVWWLATRFVDHTPTVSFSSRF